jgi:hypothetical protein
LKSIRGRDILVSKMHSLNISSDGGGLYAYQKDSHHCNVVDSQGRGIGSIERKHTIGGFGFVNGLVYIINGERQSDDNYSVYYYHPDGTLLFNI